MGLCVFSYVFTLSITLVMIERKYLYFVLLSSSNRKYELLSVVEGWVMKQWYVLYVSIFLYLWVLKLVLNSFPPSAAYMRHCIGSALLQIMACRLFGAKPLSKPMPGYCQLVKRQWNFNQNTMIFIHKNASENIVAKWRLFCPPRDELIHNDEVILYNLYVISNKEHSIDYISIRFGTTS